MKSQLLRKTILSFLLGISLTGITQTDSLSLDDKSSYYALSFEELLNLEVKVASKKAEKISDAPGMITSYASSDVERFGYYTLKDLANITSGYSTFSAFGETNIETRGQKAGSWNASKHLLMIDGIPVNHSRANSAPMEYQVPLFFADKVEFLKGPGSALYGTSAFYGVMNIQSKKLKEEGAFTETKITYGDAGRSRRLMSNSILKNTVGETNLSFSYFKKGFSGDELGANGGTKHFNNDNSMFLNSSFKFTSTSLKGITLGVIYMRRNSHAGEFWGPTPSPLNEVTWEQYIPYLKYELDINDKLSFNSYLKYNGSTEKSTYGGSSNTLIASSQIFAGYNFTTADIEGLAEISYEINDRSNIIVGINIDSREELSSPTSFSWEIRAPADTTIPLPYEFNTLTYSGPVRVNVASAFAQYSNEFNILEGLILTAGGRLDNGFSQAGTYTQFSPRIGLVQKLTSKLNIKALYGQALRVPGVKEIGLNLETIDLINKNGGNGNTNDIPEVGAEVIKSFEAGINYNNKKFSSAMACFYNITTNALDGTQYFYTDKNGEPQTPNYFENTNGEIVAKGFEIDLQYAMNKNFRIMLNHAFAKAIINDTTDFIDVPTQKTNAAVTFVLPGRFKLATTAILRQNWGYTVTEDSYNSDDVKMNNKTEMAGFTMLDLNLQMPINKNFGIEFQVRNLLDTQWKQPSLHANNVDEPLLGQNSMIPLARRNFMFSIYGKF